MSNNGMPLKDDEYVYQQQLTQSQQPKKSRFETFMLYSSEKEITSSFLAQVLRDQADRLEEVGILDIGGGNGDLALSTVSRSQIPINQIHLTFIEPAENLMNEFTTRAEFQGYSAANLSTFHGGFEHFNTDSKFDIIIASNLYHLKNDGYAGFIEQALSLLNKGGKLLFIMRSQTPDDTREFRTLFTPLITGKAHFHRDMSDVLKTIATLTDGQTFQMRMSKIESVLRFPLDNAEDSNGIIEFCLNVDLEILSPEIVAKIYEFIRMKDGTFHNFHDVLEITKLTN